MISKSLKIIILGDSGTLLAIFLLCFVGQQGHCIQCTGELGCPGSLAPVQVLQGLHQGLEDGSGAP